MPGPEKYRSQHSDLIRVSQQGQPEAMMTWVRLPGGRIRLYASRNLHDTAWGQRTIDSSGQVVWHFDGNLDHVLVVDRPTAAEAMMWVLGRWNREDRDSAEQARLGEIERGS